MFIENWLAAITLAGLFAFALVPSIGWYAESMRLEKAEKQNKALIEDKAHLESEVARLTATVNFLKIASSEKEQ